MFHFSDVILAFFNKISEKGLVYTESLITNTNGDVISKQNCQNSTNSNDGPVCTVKIVADEQPI